MHIQTLQHRNKNTDKETSTNEPDGERYVEALPLLDKTFEHLFEEKALRKHESYQKVIVGHVNINSIRNKIENLNLVIKDYVNIFLVWPQSH